jgi:hypothetical protein
MQSAKTRGSLSDDVPGRCRRSSGPVEADAIAVVAAGLHGHEGPVLELHQHVLSIGRQ